MKLFLFLILIFSFNLLYSQIDSTDNDLYNNPELMASFPGGMSPLYKFLTDNIKYPKEYKNSGISGTCYIKFIVEKDGSISNVVVTKGIPNCVACDSEAVRVIKNMPKWEPSINKGKKVRSELLIPIRFNAPYKQIDNETFKLELEHYKKADKFYKNGDYENAIKEYTEILKLVPYETDALFKRGELYLKQNQADKACQDWHKIREFNKTFANEMIDKYCK